MMSSKSSPLKRDHVRSGFYIECIGLQLGQKGLSSKDILFTLFGFFKMIDDILSTMMLDATMRTDSVCDVEPNRIFPTKTFEQMKVDTLKGVSDKMTIGTRER